MNKKIRFLGYPGSQIYEEGSILNGYEVVEIMHNKGGMSIIYEVLDSEKQKKILKSPRNIDHSEFLVNESRIIADLNQKNINGIVESYEPFDYEGLPFLPLEKLETEIEDYLDKGYYFGMVGVFIDFMSDVLTSLKKEGIVHRDIKPGNVMADKKGFLKLFDFGVAVNLVEEGLKRYGKLSSLEELYKQKHSELIKKMKLNRDIVLGTLGYIAPENMLGALPLPCNDMYSFGKTLVRLLLEKGYPEECRRLFRNTIVVNPKGVNELAEEHRTDSIETIKAKILLPKTLETILETTLSVNPDDRPTTEELKEMNIEYMRTL